MFNERTMEEKEMRLRRYKKLYPDAKFECLNRKYNFKELFDEKG